MKLYSELEKFYSCYRGEKRIIGYSRLCRPLFAFRVGQGRPVALVQGAVHAREWITAALVLKQIARGVSHGSAWFVPMVNPDGCILSLDGLSSVPREEDRRFLLSVNGESEDFSLFKANARAVDLNVNFAARWGRGKTNRFAPSPSSYVGERPFSEPESCALARFTKQICPDYTLSYHTQGEEIYWAFHQPLLRRMRDKRLARYLSRLTGYPLCSCKGSVGGYKDWCIERLHIPAFTVEVGSGKHPLGMDCLPEISARNGNSVDGMNEYFYYYL